MKKRRTKKRRYKAESHLERDFLKLWKQSYPALKPAPQYRFHPTRQYRFDFAWPTKKVAVEIQGQGPGHFSLKGATKDYNRHLAALLLNWKIVYITSDHLYTSLQKPTFAKIARLLGHVAPQRESLDYIPLRRR